MLVLAGTLIVTGLRLRRGWQWLVVRLSRSPALGKIRTYRDGFWHLLGVATVTDVSPQQNLMSGRNLDIVRHGLSWSITQDFWNAANSVDDLDLDAQSLNSMIRGPFCLECGTRLFVRPPADQPQDALRVLNQCPRSDCARKWTARTDQRVLEQFKRALMGRLLAELRVHHQISPQQEPSLRRRQGR